MGTSKAVRCAPQRRGDVMATAPIGGELWLPALIAIGAGVIVKAELALGAKYPMNWVDTA